MDLNFFFYHNFLIRCFQGALRRDLIEDSFFKEAYSVFDSKPPASFICSSVVFHVICSSQNLSRLMHIIAYYLLVLFHQWKRFYAENVKAKEMRNEIR